MLFIVQISEIDDISQSLTIQMYLNVAWRDSRIIVNETHPSWKENLTGPANVR